MVLDQMAERVGFEPTIRLPVCRISSAVLSTAQPPLREAHLSEMAVARPTYRSGTSGTRHRPVPHAEEPAAGGWLASRSRRKPRPVLRDASLRAAPQGGSRFRALDSR